MQNDRRGEIDSERLVSVAVLNDVDDMLIEEGRQLRPSGQFEDLCRVVRSGLARSRLLGRQAAMPP